MCKRIIRLVVYRVYRMKILSHVELRKMKYGIEVIFNELIKIIILLILFAALNKLTHFLFSLIILMTIRCSSGGLHFQTNLNCLLFSIIFFTASTYEGVYVLMDSPCLRYSVMTFSILAIGLFSPVASINRPIKNKRKLRLLKFTAVLFTVFLAYILLFRTWDPGLAACGIITIMLQASQLLVSYGINRFRDADILSRTGNGNLLDKVETVFISIKEVK